MRKRIATAPDNQLTKEEPDYKRAATEWMQKEGAYINIQSAKPMSLGFGLSDSPVGMAGWLVEKYHDWSDWERFSIDDLLDNLTLCWMTNCATRSKIAGTVFQGKGAGTLHHINMVRCDEYYNSCL